MRVEKSFDSVVHNVRNDIISIMGEDAELYDVYKIAQASYKLNKNGDFEPKVISMRYWDIIQEYKYG